MKPLPIDDSLSGPLVDIIAKRFPTFADELGLKLTYDRYYPEAFGNSVVIYESATHRLQIITDRGEVRVEVASTEKPEVWWTIRELYRLIHGESPEIDPMLNGTIAFLRVHYRDLLRALGPEYADARREEEIDKEKWIRWRSQTDKWRGHPDDPNDGWFKRFLNRFRL